jgi:hypothetical protein
MNDEQPVASGASELPDKIKFDYIKNHLFRVVHADGVWGGVTPNSHLFMSFWSERPPIPKQMVFPVTSAGDVGAELRAERQGRDSIFREVEVGVMMDLSTARSFLEWLKERIAIAEKASDSNEKNKGK